jgi:peroxiredoxin
VDQVDGFRRYFPFIAVLLIAAGIVVAVNFGFSRRSSASDQSIESSKVRDPAPEVGAPAPDFTLRTTKGEEIQLSSLKGSPILINFWATWCGPCRIEMPAIQDRFEHYSEQNLTVLAVNFDEPLEDVRRFGEEFELTFDLLLDPGGEIQRLYLVRGYPTSFFVDREGIIRAHQIGVMTDGQLDTYLLDIGLE